MQEIEIDFDNTTYEKLEEYMKDNKLDSVEQAIQGLVEIGLKQKEKLKKLN